MRLLLLFLLLPLGLFAQLTPEAAVDAMGRGINLGNTLEPPTESAWNNGPAQESYFDRYVEAGFTNVRVPVRWDEHTMTTPPYTVDATWMDRVEEVVDWGLERGLYITLNGHHEDWLKENYSAANQARYDAIWEQIVERFQDKSDLLIYEMINEPKGLTVAQVDDLNARILGIIRAEEPTRLVIYGGNEWANLEQLFTADIPDDDYVIGYYHSYDPWPFAGEHQGTWGTASDYQAMSNKLASAAGWSAANGVPIHVSEFGARVEADYNSRMRYYAHYVDQLQFHNLAWSVWDDGGWFGVLNRGAGTWPEVKDILIHTHNDSPNRFIVEPDQNEAGAPAVGLRWNNRATDDRDIIVQRLAGTQFQDYATLPGDATSFLDEDVLTGSTYTYRLVTERPDGTPVHGYPQRIFLTSSVQAFFGDAPQVIPGTIEAEDYDLGGEGLAYHDEDPNNIPGAYRPDEGVDVEPNGGSGFQVGYVAAGEWIEYTVNVTETGTYRVAGLLASEQPNGAFEISFPDDNIIRMGGIPATGGWTAHEEMTFGDNITLDAGEQVMRISITGTAPFNIDNITFELIPDATEEASIAAGFLVSPNPVSHVLNVSIPTNGWQGQTPEVQIINSFGQVVRRYPTTNNQLQLHLGDLPKGTYFLRMTDGPRTLIRRVVKQ